MFKRTWLIVVLVVVVLGVLVAALARERGGSGQQPESAAARQARAEFYAAYEDYRAAPGIGGSASSVGHSPEQAPHLKRMAEMGPKALPYLIEEARRTGDPNLNLPIGAIAKVSFLQSEWPGAENFDDASCLKLYIEWWEAGQAATDALFEEAYARGDYDRMAALGVAALPRMMEKVREGDERMLELFRESPRLRISDEVTESREACLKWWEENKQDWIIPFPDQTYE